MLWARRSIWRRVLIQAGLLAALRAGDLGLSTLLLERDGTQPSNTWISSALVPAAGTTQQRAAGIEDTPEDLAADIRARNGGRVEDPVLAMICCRSADVVTLLEDSADIGMRLHLNSLHPGHRCHRMHGPASESGAELIVGLRRAVVQRPSVEVRDPAELASLLIEEGRVVGVQTAAETHRASSVLLATGGFGANGEMLRRHCLEIAGGACTGSPTSTGGGIHAGLTAGAALAQMGAYQAHAHHNPDFGTHLSGALPGLGAILVNRGGRRFSAEDAGSSQFAAAVLAQPGGGRSRSSMRASTRSRFVPDRTGRPWRPVPSARRRMRRRWPRSSDCRRTRWRRKSR